MTFESTIQKSFFPAIEFLDERERQVFHSYIRGFTILSFDPTVKTILEIGGGHSTALLAAMGETLGWNLLTIDMNPEAVVTKLRSQLLSEKTLTRVDFKQGFSIPPREIRAFYEKEQETIGGVRFEEALESAKAFIKIQLDARKAPKVSNALQISHFEVEDIVKRIINRKKFSTELLQVFRTPGDEFDYGGAESENVRTWLDSAFDTRIDAIFLDSGEFSGLPEWEIVNRRLRVGGYVILHDIFFPKSFKNWVVCGALMADANFEALYIDETTPQGLMVARKRG